MHTRLNELSKLLNILFASLPLRLMHLIISRQILKRISAKVSLFLVSLNSCEIFNALRSISLLPLSFSFATTPSCMWHTHTHKHTYTLESLFGLKPSFRLTQLREKKLKTKIEKQRTENSKEAKKLHLVPGCPLFVVSQVKA